MAISSYSTTDILEQSGTTGQKVERKLLLTYVNTAAFGTNYQTTPTWTLVGRGVEDSNIAYNPDVSTVTDITGVTETSVNKMEMSQSLDPMTLRKGSALHVKLLDIIERKAWSELALFEVMIVRGYLEELDSTATVYHAEKHQKCTITPQSEGGSSYVDMPINITLSNDKALGTVASLNNPTFTALSSST